MDSKFVCVLVFSLLCFLESVLCCTDKWPPSIDGQIYWSDYLANGKVLKIMDKSDSSTMYSLQFQVDCTYKGKLPRLITIEKAGINPRVCHKSQFKVGPNYLITINKTDTAYETTFAPIELTLDAVDQYVDEVAITCGLEANYATDINEADKASAQCFEVDPEDCETYEPPPNFVPPTPAPPTTTAGPTTPRVTYSPDGKGNNTVIIPGETKDENGDGCILDISKLALIGSLLLVLLTM